MGKLSYNDKLRIQTLWQVYQSHCLQVYAERLSQCGRLYCMQTFLPVLNFHSLSGYNWK